MIIFNWNYIKKVLLSTLNQLRQLIKNKRSDSGGKTYTYSFKTDVDGEETLIGLTSSIPLRNYETILKDKDDSTFCNKCKRKLKYSNVRFSIVFTGETTNLRVQYCKKCDIVPKKNMPATLRFAIDGKMAFLRV